MASNIPKEKGGHENDLTAILTSEERVEFTLLIANITEGMHKQIADTFEATTGDLSKQDLGSKNPNVDENLKETEEEEKARKLREKREKELSAPKILELKKDALNFFQEWRESVMARVGEVVNNPKETVDDQKKKASANATPAPPTDTKIVSK